MNTESRVGVLFVCMGNICRSPTAEGMFRKLVESRGLSEHFDIDSAGTHSYHEGGGADSRASQTALQRGVDLSPIRSRRIELSDFDRFDYVIAMDQENYSTMSGMIDARLGEKIHLFMKFADDSDPIDVPDPYYGGDGGFETVFNMIEAASHGLLAEIEASGRLGSPQQ